MMEGDSVRNTVARQITNSPPNNTWLPATSVIRNGFFAHRVKN